MQENLQLLSRIMTLVAERASEAPPEFVTKTLTGDMQDIAAVVDHNCFFMPSKLPMRQVSFCCQRFSNSRLFICGLSTGAFLSLAYAASKDVHPPGGTRESAQPSSQHAGAPVAGCFTFACVDDIPGSVAMDFSEDQVSHRRGFFPVLH